MVERTKTNEEIIQWLLECDEPWTRYQTRKDILEQPETANEVAIERAMVLAHPQTQMLIQTFVSWPGYALKRHNDSGHPLYAFSTLADFGLRAEDSELGPGIRSVLAHQTQAGAFQTLIQIAQSFGGSGENEWAWMLCDMPTLLYALLAMGLGDRPEIRRAISHLVDLVDENGWRCIVAPELGRFRGPGRKTDPCPIANVFALKALSLDPSAKQSPAVRAGIEAILNHWDCQKERKIYMFGIGSDFRKLKYPFIWYDILHVVDTLSRFPTIHDDPRFNSMWAEICIQADDEGYYTPGSMYRPWKDWPFSDKKRPSPWITMLIMRIQKRLSGAASRSSL